MNDVARAANDVSVFGTSPDDWTVDRLRDRLAPVVGGEWGEAPDAHDEGVEIAVIRVADIRGLGVACEDLTLRRIKESKLVGRLIGLRTLLIEKSGGGEQTPVGRTVLGRNLTSKAICSNFMAKADCRENVSPTFAAYLLDSAYCSGVNTAHIQQTTGIQNLRVVHYLNTKYAFPPLQEQERIAAYLDASCTAIDAAVAAKRQQIKTLDGVRKAIIQAAVTRGLEVQPTLRRTGNVWLNEVPSSWELVSLKRISEVQTGLTLGKVYEGALIERPYLRVANVQDGHLNLDDVTTIEVPKEVAQRVTLRAGDVLMTEGGDLDKLGRGTIWTGEIADCLHQNHIFTIRCFSHKLLPAFLAYLTASQYGRDYFEATGKRTTNLASTNSTKVGLFPIPRPLIEEQQAICESLDARLAHTRKIVDEIGAQIITLVAYRKSLIHECVTGQRRVTEADVKQVQTHG